MATDLESALLPSVDGGYNEPKIDVSSAKEIFGNSTRKKHQPLPTCFKCTASVSVVLGFFLLLAVFGIGVTYHKVDPNSYGNPFCIFAFSQTFYLSQACGSQSQQPHQPSKVGPQPNTPQLPKDPQFEYQWAVLLAGSKGWWNYRHQADVCHAYHVLQDGGLSNDHIVVMMYDDIAYNEFNPFPGQIFNQPDGPNVYQDVPHDYTGEQVTKQTFKDILYGVDTHGKALESNSSDRVFVYFTDHGGPGFINFPNNELMMADEFHDMIIDLYARGRFKEMVIYIEACNSGQMFMGDNKLPDHIPVYATTAANADESSFAAYCPKPGIGTSKINTCLGDLYSVSWMENSEQANLQKESLQNQYQVVRNRTSQDFTYQDGSHVMQFGNYNITSEAAGEYLGYGNAKKYEAYLAQQNNGSEVDTQLLSIRADSQNVNTSRNGFKLSLTQREADILPLVLNYASKSSSQAKFELQFAAMKRWQMDEMIRYSVNDTLQLYTQFNMYERYIQDKHSMDDFVSKDLSWGQNGTLVDDWDCYRGMIQTWYEVCGELDSYGLQYAFAWINLCNIGVTPHQYGFSLESVCQGSSRSNGEQQIDGDCDHGTDAYACKWEGFVDQWNNKLDTNMTA